MILTFKYARVEYKHAAEIMTFYSFDLHLDPMTLVLKLNLDIIKLFKSYHLDRQTGRLD